MAHVASATRIFEETLRAGDRLREVFGGRVCKKRKGKATRDAKREGKLSGRVNN